jgi:hypothetical protein
MLTADQLRSTVGATPYGFFTVEQWKRPNARTKPQWIAIKHLDARNTLSSAIEMIATNGKPGFFRVLQTQRMIQAEKIDGGAWIAASRIRKR